MAQTVFKEKLDIQKKWQKLELGEKMKYVRKKAEVYLISTYQTSLLARHCDGANNGVRFSAQDVLCEPCGCCADGFCQERGIVAGRSDEPDV